MSLNVGIVPVTAFGQNCALLWKDASKRGVVVDPGGDVPRIRAAIDRAGMTVERILLTHGHIDHAGGAAELREALGVEVVGPHRDDAFLLDALPEQGARFGLEDARAVVPDRWLEEGDAVEIGGERFAVSHCPGHSPGHVIFAARALGFAVLGDVLFQGSIGRTDFPYGDHAALLASIRDKVLPLGDEVRFVCGHGAGSTIGAERRTNPFLREIA